MMVEGTNFNEKLVKLMKKKDFICIYKNALFLDRSVDDREKLLSGIYDRITKKRDSLI